MHVAKDDSKDERPFVLHHVLNHFNPDSFGLFQRVNVLIVNLEEAVILLRVLLAAQVAFHLLSIVTILRFYFWQVVYNHEVHAFRNKFLVVLLNFQSGLDHVENLFFKFEKCFFHCNLDFLREYFSL